MLVRLSDQWPGRIKEIRNQAMAGSKVNSGRAGAAGKESSIQAGGNEINAGTSGEDISDKRGASGEEDR